MIASSPRSLRGSWSPPSLQASLGGLPMPLWLARVVPLLLGAAVFAAAIPLASVLSQRIDSIRAPETGQGQSSLSALFTPEVQRWSSEIETWSARYGLPAPLVATVMQIESCGDPGARSGAGAQGLFQVMPFHFAPGEAAIDPETNARRGLGYLARSLELAGGRVDLALAGYNGGHSRIAQSAELWPDETRRYVAWGSAIYADAASGRPDSPALDSWLQAGGARLCRAASALPM